MNFKKLILLILAFICLSYYYFHHELEIRSVEKNKKTAEKKIIHLENEQTLSFISIKNSFGKFILEKDDNGSWHITSPVTYPADSFKAQSIESTLTIDSKIRDFDTDTFDFAAVGLDESSQRIGIGYDDIKKYLLLGNETHIGTNHYARWEDQPNVFLVSENFYGALQQDLKSLRKRTLFEIDSSNFDGVTVKLDEYDAEFEKLQDIGKRRWWITAPIENRVKPNEFLTAIRTLSNLIANEYYDSRDPSDVEFGFSESEYFISVKHRDAIQRLKIGNRTEDGRSYYALYEGRDVVVTVAADVIDSLKLVPEDIVDKHITLINPYEVNRFVYEKGERADTFYMDADYWYSETESAIDTEELTKNVRKLLSFVAELEYVSILISNQPDELQINADDVIFSLQLTSPGQTDLVRFFELPDSFVILQKDDPNYYEISADSYEKINEFLKSFL